MTTTPHTSSLAQANEATVRTVYDAYNARDFDRAAGLASGDAEIVIVPFSRSFRGPAGMREFQRGWATAFPDSATEVRTVTANDERVAVEYVGRGTHRGTLATPAGDVAATGRRVEIPLCDVFELRDSKIVRARSYFDAATMMAQLGLMPASAGAASA